MTRKQKIEGIRNEVSRESVDEKTLVRHMRHSSEYAGILAQDYDEVGDVVENLEGVAMEARLAADLAECLLVMRREGRV